MTGHFSRNLSRDDWKVIHRVIRHDDDWHFHPPCSPVHNNINTRAALWAKINEHAVNGRVGRVTAGMEAYEDEHPGTVYPGTLEVEQA